MKKTIIYIAITLLALPMALAQEFNVGTNAINAGIGLGSSFSTFSTASEGLGLSVSYERGIWDLPGPGVVSLGGYLGRKTFKSSSAFSDNKWSYTIVGARGAYHFNGLNVEKLDVYGGAMLSYNIFSFNGVGSNFGSSALSGTGFVGGRWYFTDTIAVFAEGGYGVAFLTFGATFRL